MTASIMVEYPLLLMLMLLLSHPAINAIKCHDCRSDQGSCNDGECAGTVCIKLETSSKSNDKRTVLKGCSLHYEMSACQQSILGTKRTLRCVCSTELCNSDTALIEAGLEEDRRGNGAGSQKLLTFAEHFGFSISYLIMLIFICLFIAGSFSLLIVNTVCVHLC